MRLEPTDTWYIAMQRVWREINVEGRLIENSTRESGHDTLEVLRRKQCSEPFIGSPATADLQESV